MQGLSSQGRCIKHRRAAVGNRQAEGLAHDSRRGFAEQQYIVVIAGGDLQHVADAVLYMASLPLDANVATLTVMATQMPYVGRG